MDIAKPASIARDQYRSDKWDEIVVGRSFRPSDVPALTLLVQWYQVVDQCIEDLGTNGGIQVAYSNDMGDIKALPQISTMKQASAEIRALNKQLGINDGRDTDTVEEDVNANESFLKVIQGAKEERRAAATN